MIATIAPKRASRVILRLKIKINDVFEKKVLKVVTNNSNVIVISFLN